jgi:hypothetical protein
MEENWRNSGIPGSYEHRRRRVTFVLDYFSEHRRRRVTFVLDYFSISGEGE